MSSPRLVASWPFGCSVRVFGADYLLSTFNHVDYAISMVVSLSQVFDKIAIKVPDAKAKLQDIQKKLEAQDVTQAWQLEFLDISQWERAGASDGVYAAAQSVLTDKREGVIPRLAWEDRRSVLDGLGGSSKLSDWHMLYLERGCEECISRLVGYFNNLGLVAALYCAISLALLQTDRAFWRPKSGFDWATNQEVGDFAGYLSLGFLTTCLIESIMTANCCNYMTSDEGLAKFLQRLKDGSTGKPVLFLIMGLTCTAIQVAAIVRGTCAQATGNVIDVCAIFAVPLLYRRYWISDQIVAEARTAREDRTLQAWPGAEATQTPVGACL
jgi:hypothetical protein